MTGLRLACVWVALAMVLQGPAALAAQFTVDEAALNRLEFPVPENGKERAYLGLSGNNTFRLPSVRVPILFVEIFSMYCPICQSEAPKINELYTRIQKSPTLKDKVKMVGIGIGNTPFEVEVFRKKFEIPFPLFSDEDFSVEKISRQRIRTPTFLVLEVEQGNKVRILDALVGRIEDIAGLVENLEQTKGK
ncbi:MAG: redoxin domain-containing protein [Thermodesulfobacteriota bacterium]